MSTTGELFAGSKSAFAPLADRVRPKTFADVVGQDHLVGPEGILTRAVEQGSLHSFILWGPPGIGKTTIARIFAEESELEFVPFSAVLSGIKEVKEVMNLAHQRKHFHGNPTVVFVDEIHRFNKAQQDAFLPFVEQGDVLLIGATTENPSFEVINALLSRTRVYLVHELSPEDLVRVLKAALTKDEVLQSKSISIEESVLHLMASKSHGDARGALTLLEAVVTTATETGKKNSSRSDAVREITSDDVLRVLQKSTLYYDKTGDEHYNIISALHKSIRNSDENAALYWLARMLEGGEEPRYVARRLVRFASEDVGLADPTALILANAVKDTVDFIGMPECKLALAQLVIYLSAAPKSNSVYRAYGRVEKDLNDGNLFPVPLSIRNAPTKLMKDFGYGKDYQYAHDREEKTTDLQCLPDELQDRTYYVPTDQGREKDLAARLAEWKSKRKPKK